MSVYFNSDSNSAYVKLALKYINGVGLSENTIGDDVKNSFASIPSFAGINGVLFAGGQMLKHTDEQAVSLFTHKPKTKLLSGDIKYARAGVKGLTTTLTDMFNIMGKNGTELNAILKESKGLRGASANLEAVKGVKDLIKAGKSAEATAIIGKASCADDIVKGINDATAAAKAASAAADAAGGAAKKGFFAAAKGWIKGKGSAAIGAIGKTGFGKAVKSGVKSISNMTIGSKTIGEITSKCTGKLSKAFKGSGAGVMVAIDGTLALVTEVIPAFKNGGFGEGVKQTAKSAAKVGASTVGWLAGSKAGGALGSWIGGAIGSVVPVIGTGIGALVGGLVGDLVGGLIGSSIAGKVTEKIVGKNYSAKVQEQAMDEQAAAISCDSASMAELNSYVTSMIQQDLADDGELTEDSEKMLEYLQSGAGNAAGTSAYNMAVNTANGLDELVSRIQAGDASIYDVPQDVLNAYANRNLATTQESYANNYTNFGYSNPYLTEPVTDYTA